jgi:hypothetical protein
MQRWLTVVIASLGFALLGADAPPSLPASAISVTIFNTDDTSGRLLPLQTMYVTGEIAKLLDARGAVIDRSTERVGSFEKFGDLLCSRAKTAALLWPAVSTTVSGNYEGTGAWNDVVVELRLYDCASHAQRVFKSDRHGAYDWVEATNKSAAEALKRYLSARP